MPGRQSNHNELQLLTSVIRLKKNSIKMNFIILGTLLLAVASAAPVEETAKTKRGLYGGFGYGHASLLAPAPILHAAHAPIFHAAPLALHAPVVTKTVIPAPIYSAPLLTKAVIPHAPLALSHAPLALGHGFGHAPLSFGHSFW